MRLAGRGRGTPIYLVHAIGGDVGFFSNFAEMVADERTVYGIQVPSDKVNAEFGASIYAIAEYYVDAITLLQPEGAVILGGWSVGSNITLEMAQILKRRGREVALLIIEHDMDVVSSLADRVLVLHYGEVLAEGTFDEVKADPHVYEVYLGSGW